MRMGAELILMSMWTGLLVVGNWHDYVEMKQEEVELTKDCKSL